jgi:hypothetical protein
VYVNLVYSNQNRGEDMKNLLLVFHILLIITLVGCTKDKGVYVGEGKDGKRHGQGTVTYSNGKKYVGEFKEGKRHGKGTLTYTKKEKHKVTAKYEGEWKNGKKDGQGKFLYNMGETYEGGFKNGKRHGQGTWKHPNGRKYVGGYKNGRWHGKGVSTALDGQRWFTFYEGEFVKGKRHGQGKLVVTKIDDDGTLLGKWGLGKWKGLTVIGEFKNNRFWNVQSYNDKGEQNTLSCTLGKCTGLR